ncbi:MAG: site-specific integrase, partial [Gemmatimonadetes bacterium]|nr:site-specific integrase [Gemmatimonadota bacterium]
MVVVSVRVVPPDRLAVRCIPFDRATIEQIRSIRDRRWDPTRGCWLIPHHAGSIEELRRRFGRNALQLSPELVESATAAASDAEPAPERGPDVAASDARTTLRPATWRSASPEPGRDVPPVAAVHVQVESCARAATPGSDLEPEDCTPRVLRGGQVRPADHVPATPAAICAAADPIGRMRQELRLRNYSRKTERAYTSHVARFLRAVCRDPAELQPGDARSYLLSLLERDLSRAYQDQAISAIRFLAAHVLGRPDLVQDAPRPRKDRKLPSVLSGDEIRRLLGGLSNPRHRALLMLIYSAGLRVGEAVRLRAEDLDLERGLVHVRGGKNRKDRYTLLSDVAVRAVHDYQRTGNVKPHAYLFAGSRPDRPLAVRSAQKIVARARVAAGITKRTTPHT